MIVFRKHQTRHVVLTLGTALLLMFLAACGGTGGTSASTPTTPPATPTPSFTLPSTTMKTFNGTGYTIEYPSDWTEQNTNGEIVFKDSLGVDLLSITVAPDPNATVSADEVDQAGVVAVENAVGIKNAQPDPTVQASTSVGGEAWVQRGITGTKNVQGQDVPVKSIVLADNHPASSPTTQSFTISYGGPSSTFDALNTTAFQPMLQSFKFTS